MSKKRIPVCTRTVVQWLRLSLGSMLTPSDYYGTGESKQTKHVPRILY